MRSQRESRAIDKINELTDAKFIELAKKNNGIKWHYAGSNSKKEAEDAHWIRFNNDYYEIIACDMYGGQYSLIKLITVDLDTLKSYAGDIIGFGDGTENGQLDPENEEEFARIIDNIVFSFLGYGGGDSQDILRNSDLSEKDSDIVNALQQEFEEIANAYDIPINE